MSELCLERNNVLIKEISIAVVVGLSYFLLLATNPSHYLTGAASIAALANVRWANMLRPMALSHPLSAVGIASGSWAFNLYSGKAFFGAYSIMPVLFLGLALLMHKLANYEGRTLRKDLFILTLWGLLSGILASLHLTSVAMLFDFSVWEKVFSIAFSWKVFSHVMVLWIGYPLVLLFDKKWRKQ